MKLFEPGYIGSKEIKNRIVMAPMGVVRIAESDGFWGKRVRDYYIARARGGVGLITTSVVFVTQELEPFTRHGHMNVYLDKHLEALREMVAELHKFGSKVSVQLSAGFGRVLPLKWHDPEMTPVSASAQPCYLKPEKIARAITTQEAKALAQSFGAATKRCQMAGVDAVEFHGHSGYILDQFMTGLWNQRTDRYGGSPDKRLTLVREAVSAIKREVGDDFPIIYRYGVDHHLKGARTVDDSLWIARQLDLMGFDALHVDAGCYGSSWFPHPPIYTKHKCVVDMAEKVKSVVKVPVIAVGKLQSPNIAEEVLQAGQADFIAMARGLLADPEWPNKVSQGRSADIRPCIGDNEGCLTQARFSGMVTSCTVNPTCGHEIEWEVNPARRKSTILIIGGGPAGMEAARVAAIRRMDVTLWERTHRLGGNLWPASEPKFKRDIRTWITYQTGQLKKLPLKIQLETEGTLNNILSFGADHVILATGALSGELHLPGANSHIVITAVDLLENKPQMDSSVMVVGAGLIGCETAVYLAQQNHRVTLTSRRDTILTDLFVENRDMLLCMMNESGVQLLKETWPTKIVANGVSVSQQGQNKVLPIKCLVTAGKMRPWDDLQKSLEGKVKNLHVIGDCAEPKRVLDAIWAGFHLARQIAD